MGTNRTWLSLYSPLGLTSATVDGGALQVQSTPELGVSVYSAYLNLPPGGTMTVVAHLRGQLRPGKDYTLHLRRQPMVLPDHYSIKVAPTTGWALARPSQAMWTPGEGQVESRRVVAIARSA